MAPESTLDTLCQQWAAGHCEFVDAQLAFISGQQVLSFANVEQGLLQGNNGDAGVSWRMLLQTARQPGGAGILRTLKDKFSPAQWAECMDVLDGWLAKAAATATAAAAALPATTALVQDIERLLVQLPSHPRIEVLLAVCASASAVADLDLDRDFDFSQDF